LSAVNDKSRTHNTKGKIKCWAIEVFSTPKLGQDKPQIDSEKKRDTRATMERG